MAIFLGRTPLSSTTSINQYLLPEFLKVCNKLDTPIILHLPKSLYDCHYEIRKLIENYPGLPIVLAHAGLIYKKKKSLRPLLNNLRKYPNLFIDTSMAVEGNVLAVFLDKLGPKKIIYGSDEPLHLIRAIHYEVPNVGFRYITEYPYHWVIPELNQKYGHLAINATHIHWQSLLAIKEAIKLTNKLQFSKTVQSIFYKNSAKLFRFD